MGEMKLTQRCIAYDKCLAAAGEVSRKIEAVIHDSRARSEEGRTCETCVSYNGVGRIKIGSYDIGVRYIAGFACAGLGVEQARDCGSYHPDNKLGIAE
jgi:hypothetical protein